MSRKQPNLQTPDSQTQKQKILSPRPNLKPPRLLSAPTSTEPSGVGNVNKPDQPAPEPTVTAKAAVGNDKTVTASKTAGDSDNTDEQKNDVPEVADGATKTQDADQEDDLGTREIQHMSSLEHDIYHAINEGQSIEPDSIRKRLNKKEYVPDSSIREAVNSLRKKNTWSWSTRPG